MPEGLRLVVGIKTPQPLFLAIFDPWDGFLPPGGGFIPLKLWFYPPPHLVIGGVYHPLGWIYHPFSVGLSPRWAGGLTPVIFFWGGGISM